MSTHTKVAQGSGWYVQRHWWAEGPRYLFIGLNGQQNQWVSREWVARVRAQGAKVGR
jgi:hypothetical protein